MILIAAVLAISLISFAAIKMTQKDGKEVIVTVEGKEVYKTSIKKDQIYQIPEENGTNVMQIKDGKVTMKKADCKDQICADHKAIEKSGETIVCLIAVSIIIWRTRRLIRGRKRKSRKRVSSSCISFQIQFVHFFVEPFFYACRTRFQQNRSEKFPFS